MRNRRDRTLGHNTVVHVTNRVVTGLPFTGKPYMNYLLRGILGRGQRKFPVHITGGLFLGNHYHLVLSGCPNNISPFMNYIQGEIASLLKRICPMYANHSKIWKGRFKEQILARPDDVLETLAYIYSNPVRAGLVSSIEDYPGFNTYKMHKSGSFVAEFRFVPRRSYAKESDKLESMSPKEHHFFVRKYCISVERFEIKPTQWKRCFAESQSWSDEYILQRLETRLQEIAECESNTRSRPVIGKKKLLAQSRHTAYIPGKKPRERTPFLICRDKELRLKLIEKYKYFCQRCREAWEVMKKGGKSIAFPKGGYLPGFPFLSFPRCGPSIVSA